MRWALQLAVILALPLALLACVWGAVLLLRWVRAHRAHAAAAGAELLVSDSLGGFRDWLGERFDSFAETGGSDSAGADHGFGDCDAGGGSGGDCSD